MLDDLDITGSDDGADVMHLLLDREGVERERGFVMGVPWNALYVAVDGLLAYIVHLNDSDAPNVNLVRVEEVG